MRNKRDHVQWLVDAIESKRTINKISLIESIALTVNAWKSLEETVISNCWLHTGFVPVSEESHLQALRDYKKVMDLDLTDLTKNLKELSVEASVEEYITVDDLDESELHERYQSNDSNDGDHDSDQDVDMETEVMDESITGSEAMDAFLKLNSFLLQHYEQSHDEIKLLSAIESKVRALSINSKKQTMITEFFS
jgi:hypothetical protein